MKLALRLDTSVVEMKERVQTTCSAVLTVAALRRMLYAANTAGIVILDTGAAMVVERATVRNWDGCAVVVGTVATQPFTGPVVVTNEGSYNSYFGI